MYIVRHSPSLRTESRERRLDIGDPDLSERGEIQAESLQDLVENLGITAVVTARNKRCFRTGAIATYGLGISLHVSADLNELDWGTDAGRLQSDVFKGPVDDGGVYRGLDLRTNPRAETCLEVASRLLAVMEAWQGADEKPLLVTSGQVIKSTVAVTNGWPRSQMLKYHVPHGQIMWYEPASGSLPDYIHPQTAETHFMPAAGRPEEAAA